MSVEGALARGRVAAEALMVDACTIGRRGSGGSVDDTSGVITPDRDVVYTGKCRVQQRQASSGEQRPGEDFQLLVSVEVQLPMSVTGLEVGDQVTITASIDPELVGEVFLIRDLFAKTHATSRRVGVTRRTS